ncbi:MAG: protein translocase subunit SecY [Herpetosiphonaceae bacterium]|nr:MAG: protein translocase subunit SecY [Herpetosiphonaceae bacterium]
MRQAVVSAWKIAELRSKITFTLGMLLIFRLIAHIPVPHVDLAAIRQATEGSQILGLLNLFSGGALSQFSVAAMGVYPYITASIIMQLLTPLIPALQELSKEGEQGRNRINRYTYWLTVPLAYLQGYGQTLAISRQVPLFGEGFNFSITQNFFPTLTILTMMVAGTMLLIWMGELIDEKGIGNGLSIIIFGGIVSRLPAVVYQGFQETAGAEQGIIRAIMLIVIALATVVGIVLITEGQRRIPVQYAKRVRGNKVYGGQSSYIPLKVNMAGMIPLIFAQSILILPSTLASYFYNPDPSATGIGNRIAGFFYNSFGAESLLYTILLFLMVVGFTFFYTLVLFQQQNLSESLQRNGGFIPGIRPGRNTDVYLQRVLTRITLVGALFLGVVAAMPFFAQQITGLQLGLSSTALLIVVGVAVDTMRQLEAQLLMRNYEGFISR